VLKLRMFVQAFHYTHDGNKYAAKKGIAR
jgi:hypothetical protein